VPQVRGRRLVRPRRAGGESMDPLRMASDFEDLAALIQAESMLFDQRPLPPIWGLPGRALEKLSALGGVWTDTKPLPGPPRSWSTTYLLTFRTSVSYSSRDRPEGTTTMCRRTPHRYAIA